MFEQIIAFSDLPLILVAALLFGWGLILGSFSSVLLRRLPEWKSVAWSRSQCPSCKHALSAFDLVPVLSYLWLRGRCRFCQVQIPFWYPMLEVSCGLVVSGAGLLAGWPGGAVASGLWVTGAVLLGTRQGKKVRQPRSEAGFTLVDVLVALLLLSVAIVPFLDTMAVARNASWVSQRRTLVLGLARARLNQLESNGWDKTQPPDLTSELRERTGSEEFGVSSLVRYRVKTELDGVCDAAKGFCPIKVTVSCPTCAGRLGEAVPAVTIKSVVRGKVGGP